jgi:hypothetical protein
MESQQNLNQAVCNQLVQSQKFAVGGGNAYRIPGVGRTSAALQHVGSF